MRTKTTWSKMLTLIAAVFTVAAFGSMTVMADDEKIISSGNCGPENSNSLTWTFYDTGKLTISGTGEMDDYVPQSAPWYAYKESITYVDIQSGVTSVGCYAFYQYTEIQAVSFPSTLESIGERAFKGCSSLSYAIIPASEIGEAAFSESGVSMINITGAATKIKTDAFSYCSNLSYIQLPSTVESIGKYAFYGCGFSQLNEDWFHSGSSVCNLKYIEDYAFGGCANLTRLFLPTTIISIGDHAFANCGLTSVNIPEGVERINTSAFYGCTALSEVNLPDSLTVIEANAFAGCGSLTTITIPKNVTSIGNGAFVQSNSISSFNCNPDPANLTCSFDTLFTNGSNVTVNVPSRYKDAYVAKFSESNVTFNASSLVSGECGDNCEFVLDCDNVLVISGTGDMKDYEYAGTPWYNYSNDIKEIIIEDGVTSIGVYAFYYCQKLTSVTIPDSVKTIGNYAFMTCFTLESVVIPDGVTSIGLYAFSNCRSLSSVTLPDSIIYLGNSAFSGCSFTEINIPRNLTSIEEDTFSYCSELESVIIPGSVTKIGKEAFSNCTSLESVTIPDSVNTIGASAFYRCTALTSAAIPSGVTKLNDMTFYECTSLASVNIPEGLTTIGENVFGDCVSLTSAYIPSSVTKIGYSAFSGCSSLTVITLPEGITEIASSAFYNCSNLTSVNIPANVTSIGYTAFKNCSSLTAISIPASVKEIDNEAFSYCDSLTTVTIPGCEIKLGQKIFYGCAELKTVTILNGTTFIGYAAFSSCPNLEKVIIPSTVTGISQSAFNSNPNLSDLYILADPEILNWDFSYQNLPDTLKVHVPSGYVAGYEKLFADNNVNVTVIGDADGDIDIGIGVHLYGYTLSLEGDIGVNFYTKFDDVNALSDDAKMVFTITGNNGQDIKTQEVYVKPQTDADLPYAKVVNDYYIFKCTVYSNEMTSTITAKVVNGETSGKEYTYSVQEYAEYILTHADKYPDEQPLVKAMLNYGAYSQKYFNYNTDNLANSVLPVSERTVSVIDPATINAGPREGDLAIAGTNIRIEKVSLSLKETISMKLYITGADENTVFKQAGGRIFKPVKSGEYYVITIDGIKGQYIDWAFGIGVYDGDTRLGVISYSPIYYCKNVLSKATGGVITEDLKELVSAMILYKDAAALYSPPTIN